MAAVCRASCSRASRTPGGVAHPPRAECHGLQLVAPVPAPGVGTVDDDGQLPLPVPARPASPWGVPSPLTCPGGLVGCGLTLSSVRVSGSRTLTRQAGVPRWDARRVCAQ